MSLFLAFILFTELEDCGAIDLCFVIDSSGSIRDSNPRDNSHDNWELVLRFVKQVRCLDYINVKLFQFDKYPLEE